MLGLALSEVGAAPKARMMEGGGGSGVLELDLILRGGARAGREKRDQGGEPIPGLFKDGTTCDFGGKPKSESEFKAEHEKDTKYNEEMMKQDPAMKKEMEEECKKAENKMECDWQLKGKCNSDCEKSMNENAKKLNKRCKNKKCYWNSKNAEFTCSGHVIKPAFGLILVLLPGSLLSYF
jgi:hypothetical protein